MNGYDSKMECVTIVVEKKGVVALYIYKKSKRLWTMAGVYLLVACLSVALLTWGRDEPAVPVFSPQNGAGEPSAGWQRAIHWQSLIEYGFLYLSTSSREFAPWGWWDQLLQWFSGLRLGDVRSLLDAELRVLAAASFDHYLPTTGGGEIAPEPVLINLPPGSAPPEEQDEEAVPIRVGLYHTHARESFLPEMGLGRGADAHTSNLDITVVQVGKEIASLLSQDHGIGVAHSTTVHDAEGKVGSYIRSQQTVERMIRDYPDLFFLFDVHRDSALRPQTTATIAGQTMARVMILLGTDHEQWRENYAVAKDFIEIMESMYPGLSIGIYTRTSRYNQHLASGILLLEVGGVENTMEECLRTARAVAQVIARMVEAMEN